MPFLLVLQLIAAPTAAPCALPIDGRDAASALQACIDAAPPGAEIQIAAGTYILDRQILIGRPLSLRTAGLSGRFPVCRTRPETCAVFVAAAGFAADGGMLRIGSTAGVRLSHLVLDGNRVARLGSPGALACEAGNNRAGFNASAEDCAECALLDVVSQEALCGTGFEWTGGRVRIEHSTFRDNGDSSTLRMWADGLTALHVPASAITDNLFSDNSDIGVIIGHAPGTLVARNLIVQRRQHAFAGLMLDNFNSGDLAVRGDFRGAVVTANTIDCGAYRCGFGINLGPHAWYRSPNIIGGEVLGNLVSGAGVGINIDGAGTKAWPIAVYANTVRTVTERATFPLCNAAHDTSALDIASDAVVNRRADVELAARRRHWHDCQK